MAGLRWSCVGVSEAAQLRVRLVGEAPSQPGQLLLPENKSWLLGHFVMNQQSSLSWACRGWHCLDSFLCPKLLDTTTTWTGITANELSRER